MHYKIATITLWKWYIAKAISNILQKCLLELFVYKNAINRLTWTLYFVNGKRIYSYEMSRWLVCLHLSTWVLIKNNSVFKVQHIAQDKNGSLFLYGKSVKNLLEYFTLPINSWDLLIFSCTEKQLNDYMLVDIEEIRCKMFQLPPNLNDKSIVFIPILKTL